MSDLPPAEPCSTPFCKGPAVGPFPFCAACLKVHAVETARRAGEATRKKLHDTLDGAISRGLEWLFRPRT